MLRHQKLALAWMCRREASRRVSGGILAGDVGKTVATVRLILAHPRGGDCLQVRGLGSKAVAFCFIVQVHGS